MQVLADPFRRPLYLGVLYGTPGLPGCYLVDSAIPLKEKDAGARRPILALLPLHFFSPPSRKKVQVPALLRRKQVPPTPSFFFLSVKKMQVSGFEPEQ